MKKTITRFFSLTGNTLSCESRCGSSSLYCEIDLSNGAFKLERSSFNLLRAVDELKLYLSVCDNILSSRKR